MDDEIERRVGELLHYPVVGVLPDTALAGLCVWYLQRRGVLRPSVVTGSSNDAIPAPAIR